MIDKDDIRTIIKAHDLLYKRIFDGNATDEERECYNRLGRLLAEIEMLEPVGYMVSIGGVKSIYYSLPVNYKDIKTLKFKPIYELDI